MPALQSPNQSKQAHRLIFAAPIILSSFLIFLIQPILAKQILPLFGGSASVWNTCLFFFQFVLLGGYAYAYILTRYITPKIQFVIHVTLIAASITTIPDLITHTWEDSTSGPAIHIFGLLTAAIGIPYFMLSSTSPLLQAWYARVFAKPYRLFALSNAASLAGLITYPFLIEPWVDVRTQTIIWASGFIIFGIACMFASFSQTRIQKPIDTPSIDPAIQISGSLRTRWIFLAALSSVSLVSVTSFIAKNIASMPLIWVAPLALYLITFILAFDSGSRWQRKTGWIAVFLALAMAIMAPHIDFNAQIILSLPLYLGGLFFICLYCHTALANTAPPANDLALFYIFVVLGGTIGAFFTSIVAPLIFAGDFELPLSLATFGGLFALQQRRADGPRSKIAALCFASLILLAAGHQITSEFFGARLLSRNFYASLRIIESGEGSQKIRSMEHGGISHGSQYLDPQRRHEPLSYYGPSSGVGKAIAAQRKRTKSPLRIGVIGLGTGTLAAYGETGGAVDFYEIDPQVVELAKTEFTYIADSRAQVHIHLGDARIVLERKEAQNYDILAVDAFSGDAIPIHLLTREAIKVFRRHLKPTGTLLIHITNRFVNLQPSLAKLALAEGLAARIIVDEPEDDDETSNLYGSDWIVMTQNEDFLDSYELKDSKTLETPQDGPAWTDDFNTILSSIRLKEAD